MTAYESPTPVPTHSRDSRARDSRARVSRPALAGVALALVGAVVLIGWLFDIPVLQSIRPDWPSMKANTALGLLLSGVALWQLRDQPSTGWALRLSQACASLAALLGLLTLAQYVFSWNLGIDNLLVADSLHAISPIHPGRMGANSASAMLLGNAALLLLAGAGDRSARLPAAGMLSIFTLLLGLYAAGGYVIGDSAAYDWGQLTTMALHTSLAFLLLGAAGLEIAWLKGGWGWSLSTPVVAGLALGMLALVALSLESSRSTRQSVEMSQVVQRTQEARTAISDLNAGPAVALSSARGFAITGREDFLASYLRSHQQALETQQHLHELTADNPRQQARLVQLAALLEQNRDFIDEVIEIRRAGGPDPAMGMINTGKGQALLDAIYAVTAQMDSEEQGLLAQREAQSTALNTRTFLVLPIGTVVALGFFLGALLFLNAEVTERRRVATEVATSEARFRSLVLANSQIVWTTDPNGQVIGPLPSLQAFTGQSDEDIQGSGWTNALHPDDVALGLDVWARAVQNRSLYEVEYRLRRHDGAYRDFSVRGVAVLNSDGSVREWIGSCTDVTDRRKAEAERDRFFSLSLDMMCIANTDGHFHRINRAFETTLGFSEAEVLSRPFLDFIHPDDREASLEAVKSLETGAALVNFENRYLCRDGSHRWLLWSCAPVVEDGQLYAVARDITERKQVDANLRQLNAELDQRVLERTAQLEAANRELEAFTYSVSHDLRAPLRGVDSFSRMVIEDYGPKLDDEGRRMLNVVRSESQRMGRLIDDLLAFSRVGRQEMHSQSIDMTALVHDVIDKLNLPPERKRQIDVKPLAQAHGDRNLIQQVWVNLLSNALKFTSHQPTPAIEIGVSFADGLGKYHVKDNGAGFDERFVHKLFGVFQRLHTEDEFEGTGVGLALVQRIVQRHGGTVSAQGEVNKGATFYFSLPISKEHPT